MKSNDLKKMSTLYENALMGGVMTLKDNDTEELAKEEDGVTPRNPEWDEMNRIDVNPHAQYIMITMADGDQVSRTEHVNASDLEGDTPWELMTSPDMNNGDYRSWMGEGHVILIEIP